MRSFVGVLVVVFLEGCGGGRQAPPSAPPTPPAPPAASSVAAPVDAGAPEGGAAVAVPIRIETLKEPSIEPPPHVEIKFPFAEQHIAVKKAARYRVRLQVKHWPLSGNKGGVELVLDRFRPRRLDTLDSPVRLGDLVPADQKLQAGDHLLVAIAVRADGVTVKPHGGSSLQPFAAVHFWVGPRGKPSIDMKAPMLVYSQPRGTENGVRAADNVPLDFYLLGATLAAGKGSVAATISGPGVDRKLVISDWHARRISGLPSGDYAVDLVLRGAGGQPVHGGFASARRVITVNRDAPDGGKYP